MGIKHNIFRMKGVILVISGVFALGLWPEVFAESFGCPRLYHSTNPLSATSFAKTYGGTNWDYAYSVRQTSDGGYIVVGWAYYFGAGNTDIFLIKTDSNGNIGSCSIVQSASPTVNTPSPSVSSPSPTVTSPTLTVSEPCPLSISESCQPVSGIITQYKGGIKVSGSGEFEVKVYNVSGAMVKSVKGKNEVKLELSRGVYFVEVVSGNRVLREKVVIR
jgi:hypothetical protein